METRRWKTARRVGVAARIAGRILSGRPVILNLNVYTTRLCNQQCPMCNAELEINGGPSLSFEDFRSYCEKLSDFCIPTVTFSGGEPTIAPELPEMIKFSARRFPFRIGLVSNFYGRNDRFRRSLEACLRHEVNIGCSFDGFGEVADRQRGARNVSEIVTENIRWVTARKKELGSHAPLVMNTVISDTNLHQVREILNFSAELGWEHRISSVNQFYYQKPHPDAPTLTYRRELVEVLEEALHSPHLKQSRGFVEGIALYAQKRSPKFCPFITWPFKTAKVFLDHNGDISLCDRSPIGNLRSQSFEEILKTALYREKQQDHTRCAGCWLPCFVEPLTYVRPWSMHQVRRDYARDRDQWKGEGVQLPAPT